MNNGQSIAFRNAARVATSGTFYAVASPEGYQSLGFIANAFGAAAGEALTVQLRKATSAGGANAADVGPLITKTAVGAQDLFAAVDVPSGLGQTAGGVPFTHVAVVIGGTADPKEAILVRGSPRYSR